MKYRVDTEYWGSEEYTDYDKALEKYEYTKDQVLGDGVTEDSYVELVCSDDDFEDHTTLRRAYIVVDEEKMKISTPREEGFDWDYWAIWKEAEHPQLVYSEPSSKIEDYANEQMMKQADIARNLRMKLQ